MTPRLHSLQEIRLALKSGADRRWLGKHVAEWTDTDRTELDRQQ
jgi:hypothetical protein